MSFISHHCLIAYSENHDFLRQPHSVGHISNKFFRLKLCKRSVKYKFEMIFKSSGMTFKLSGNQGVNFQKLVTRSHALHRHISLGSSADNKASGVGIMLNHMLAGDVCVIHRLYCTVRFYPSVPNRPSRAPALNAALAKFHS